MTSPPFLEQYYRCFERTWNDDAPIDQAIEGVINGIYFNQGEVCCAGSRLFVQESIAEPFVERLKDRL